ELIHLYRDVMRIIERHTGMSQSRLQILHELWHAEEMSQAQLQQHLGVEGAVITRIVKQLEAEGLVTRRADPQDNRFTLVMLSAKARRHHTGTEAMKFKEAFAEQLLQGLDTEERDHLLCVMRQIGENARAIRELPHLAHANISPGVPEGTAE